MKLITALLCLATLTVAPSCDDQQVERLQTDLDAAHARIDELEAIAPAKLVMAAPVDAPDIDDREAGPPHGSYIDTWNGKPIHLAEACAAASSCSKYGDPPLLVTYSYYDPDVSVSDDWVIGVGWSAMAKGPLAKCLSSRWAANNDKPI